MRAIIIGAVESTRIAIAAVAAAPGWSLDAVVTLPPELAGRHSDFVDLSGDAGAAGARLVLAADGNAPDLLATIRDIAPDIVFVIGWSQLCGPDLLATVPGGVVGYHPAPLPRLRGRGVIPWTILLREPITAGTLFLIDAGTDSGPILAQHFFHVAPDETAAGLYAAHMAVLAAILPPLLARLAAGDRQGIVQDERHASWAARRRPEDGRIEWQAPADTVWRLVRACGDPYPGAWTTSGAQRIVIATGKVVPLRGHDAALVGQVVARGADDFVVRCGDGAGLRVTAWRRDRPGPPPLHAVLGRMEAGA
jgi:methionyl-tRNA formyltransferase